MLFFTQFTVLILSGFFQILLGIAIGVSLYLVSNNKVQIMLKLVVSIPRGFLHSVQERSILKPETQEANPSTWELRSKMANGNCGLSFAWLNSPFQLHKTPWVQKNLLGWHVFVWELGVGLGLGGAIWHQGVCCCCYLLPPELLTEPSQLGVLTAQF